MITLLHLSLTYRAPLNRKGRVLGRCSSSGIGPARARNLKFSTFLTTTINSSRQSINVAPELIVDQTA